MYSVDVPDPMLLMLLWISAGVSVFSSRGCNLRLLSDVKMSKGLSSPES